MALRSLRIVAFLAGVCLLLLVIPRRDPWDSTLIQTSGGISEPVRIVVPGLDATVSLPGMVILALSLIVLGDRSSSRLSTGMMIRCSRVDLPG